MLVYLNGEFIEKEDAKVSVDDRGFIFGDGVYEVIRVVSGRPFLAEPHMDRLVRSLEGLSIHADSNLTESILPVSRELIQKNNHGEGHATVYLQITRGAAKRTHEFPPAGTGATLYVSTSAFKPDRRLQEQGATAITLPDLRWKRCDLKTVNLLPNVLAKQKAAEAGAFSAILIRDGMVTEGQNANVFGVRNGVLQTYPLSPYILPGITRELVLEFAKEERIPVDLTPIPEDELFQMDEVFLTGTTTDIQPVVTINGRAIGSDTRGPLAKRFQELLYEGMIS